MDGKEFVKHAKELGKSKGIDVRYDKKQGKGSHGTIYFGDKKTTVKKGEIGIGLLKKMLEQLGIDFDEF